MPSTWHSFIHHGSLTIQHKIADLPSTWQSRLLTTILYNFIHHRSDFCIHSTPVGSPECAPYILLRLIAHSLASCPGKRRQASTSWPLWGRCSRRFFFIPYPSHSLAFCRRCCFSAAASAVAVAPFVPVCPSLPSASPPPSFFSFSMHHRHHHLRSFF